MDSSNDFEVGDIIHGELKFPQIFECSNKPNANFEFKTDCLPPDEFSGEVRNLDNNGNVTEFVLLTEISEPSDDPLEAPFAITPPYIIIVSNLESYSFSTLA